MKNLWTKTNFLLISILLISSVVSPVFGTGIVNNENHSFLYQLESDTTEFSLFNSNRAASYIDDSIPPINKQDAIFGDLLVKELATHEQNGVFEIKTIMLFEETTSKSEGIEFIETTFEDYVILDN